MDTLKVEIVVKRATTGGRICGTRVTFPDGYVVEFVGRTSQRAARQQAIEYRRRQEAQ